MPTSRFIQRFGDKITGVLSGLDRLILHGKLRAIVTSDGMRGLLWHKQILLKQFGDWAHGMSEQLKQASCQTARQQNRPIVYLPRPTRINSPAKSLPKTASPTGWWRL